MGIKTKEELRKLDNNELCDLADDLKAKVKGGVFVEREYLLIVLHELFYRLSEEDLKDALNEALQ